MKIKRQLEPNYTQSRNGGAEFSECIFETADGRLFKGTRSAKESPQTSRRKFLTWLNGDSEDRHEFMEIEAVQWDYSATYVLYYDANGKQTQLKRSGWSRDTSGMINHTASIPS